MSRPTMKGCEIAFDDDGDATVEGHGFSRSDGTLCETRADELIAAMGGRVTGRSYKPEYVRAPKQEIRERA